MVCSILIIVFGAISYSFLGVREYPAIDPAVISVRTTYVGASADIVEQQITEPLEKAVNGVQGVKNITSNSSQGNSSITVEFDLGVDLEKAANDVRDKVGQAVSSLPQDIDSPPIVSKSDADSDPIMFIVIQSQKKTLLELSDFAENVVTERLQTISGVSSAASFGKQYAMRLWIDPSKLAAYKLTIQDIRAALDRENIELPGGKIRGNATQLIIKTYGKLTTETEFNDLIIRETAGRIIRFRDLGTAILSSDNDEFSSRVNNVASVGVRIIAQPGSNQIEIADEVYKRVDQIKNDMPNDISIQVAYDRSGFVRKAVSEVKETRT